MDENDTMQIKRIIVALDASAHSQAAMDAAASIAELLEAELIGVFVEDINLVRVAQLPFVREVQFPVARVAEIDESGRTTRFVYDNVGRKTQTIFPDSTPNDDTDNPRTVTEYDNAGRVVAEVDERRNRTQFQYDRAGNRTVTILRIIVDKGIGGNRCRKPQHRNLADTSQLTIVYSAPIVSQFINNVIVKPLKNILFTFDQIHKIPLASSLPESFFEPNLSGCIMCCDLRDERNSL